MRSSKKSILHGSPSRQKLLGSRGVLNNAKRQSHRNLREERVVNAMSHPYAAPMARNFKFPQCVMSGDSALQFQGLDSTEKERAQTANLKSIIKLKQQKGYEKTTAAFELSKKQTVTEADGPSSRVLSPNKT